jgi:naphthalene 1,2-dioxygenase system ferredoxin subunit
MDNWTLVADIAALPADDVACVVVGGKEIAIYRVGDAVFATDGMCTHGNARLCDGFLDGFEIECPLHQGRFDVRTGKALCTPVDANLRTYPVRIHECGVLIRID